MNQQFQRIERLPPYVFNIIGELKQVARVRFPNFYKEPT